MPSDPTAPTSAQRWTDKAREVIEHGRREEFEALLADDFVHESRRVERFGFSRERFLELYDSMKELDFHIGGVAVAVAGDLHVLTRRSYISPTTRTELLAISAWTADGRLARLIEFDLEDLDDALAELSRAAGAPAELIGPGASEG